MLDVLVLGYNINQFHDALDMCSRAILIYPHISRVWFDLGSLYDSSASAAPIHDRQTAEPRKPRERLPLTCLDPSTLTLQLNVARIFHMSNIPVLCYHIDRFCGTIDNLPLVPKTSIDLTVSGTEPINPMRGGRETQVLDHVRSRARNIMRHTRQPLRY